ncbi:MAG: hypothetical protein Q8Q14_05335 [Gemmatimonadales bacterium]|nr:hypothetical protein [Gemmatimonadales bacterium]
MTGTIVTLWTYLAECGDPGPPPDPRTGDMCVIEVLGALVCVAVVDTDGGGLVFSLPGADEDTPLADVTRHAPLLLARPARGEDLAASALLDEVNRLRSALRSAKESLGLATDDASPLPPLARDVVRGFFATVDFDAALPRRTM